MMRSKRTLEMPIARRATASPSTLDQLHACPACRGDLRWQDDALACRECGRSYSVVDRIPVFVDARVAQHDELDHLLDDHSHSTPDRDEHKDSQSAFFDRAEMAEFEIERPFATPALYRFFLTEKFRRSLEPFNGRVEGWTALTVCGGSGMDAEFLAAAGATVISSDLSLGAARRARVRSSRHDVSISPIVADVERLPFKDASVDLVYVHDGLHHLEDPLAGIAEMVRVARRAVIISEPARATATSIGVRLGLALDREEAGNRVARLDLRATAATLADAGYKVLKADRYGMYYRHVPGPIMSILSQRPFLPVAIAGWRIANALLGRIGNKLTIVAVRQAAGR